MAETFAQMLAVGGRSNSLGRAEEVVQIVLRDRSRLDELYQCLFEGDAWLRMRAADSLEKVCRVNPDWLETYIDPFLKEVSQSEQPSMQWHLAQILGETKLTPKQKEKAIAWLIERLQDQEVDWIVAANAMDTLATFTHEGSLAKDKFIPLLKRQQNHRSHAVVKRATKILTDLG